MLMGQLPKYLIQNHHEGIVSRETFDAVPLYLPRPVGVLFRVAPALALRRAISSWTASKVSRLTMPSWWF